MPMLNTSTPERDPCPLPAELERGYGTYRIERARCPIADTRLIDAARSVDKAYRVLARWRAWRIGRLVPGDSISWRAGTGEPCRGLVVRVDNARRYVMARLWECEGYTRRAVKVDAAAVELTRGRDARPRPRRAAFVDRASGLFGVDGSSVLFGGVA